MQKHYSWNGTLPNCWKKYHVGNGECEKEIEIMKASMYELVVIWMKLISAEHGWNLQGLISFDIFRGWTVASEWSWNGIDSPG